MKSDMGMAMGVLASAIKCNYVCPGCGHSILVMVTRLQPEAGRLDGNYIWRCTNDDCQYSAYQDDPAPKAKKLSVDKKEV